MKRVGIIFAAFFPVIGMLLWWAQLSSYAVQGTIVEFKVEGFDPRDLLSGHYLRYRVNYGPATVCPGNTEEPRCVCIQQNGEVAEAVWSGSCTEIPQCDLWLEGQCNYNRFTAGIERYYIPEEYAQVLAVAPENSTILVAIEAGHGVVLDYHVDGRPILQYAQEKMTQNQGN